MLLGKVKIHVQSKRAKPVVTFCRRLSSPVVTPVSTTRTDYTGTEHFDTVAILPYTLTKYYKIPKIHKYSLYHALCTSLGLTDEVMVTVLTVKRRTSKVLPSIHSEWAQR